MASEKTGIKKEVLSKYQLMIAKFLKIPIDNVRKLVTFFLDKEKYVIHHENLQLYLRLGLKLKKCIIY